METAIEQPTRPSRRMKGVALVAMIFGVVTLFSGGNVLFGTDSTRELAGDYVPFVVWFNFLAGFFYLLAGIGIWLGRGWAFGLAALIAATTAIAALIFGIQVLRGSAFEMRTVGALALRTGFWAVIAMGLVRRAGQP